MKTKELLHIIHLCKQGKSDGEYKLYKYCYKEFFPICKRYMKEEERAREVMNIAFYKVIKNLPKYDTEKNFNPWAARIMVNASIDELRKVKALKIVQLSEITKTYTSDNNIATFIEEDNILNLLDHLPNMGRQVFNLYAIDGYKHREISKLLGISESTSKWHVTQSKLKLKRMLEKNNALLKATDY